MSLSSNNQWELFDHANKKMLPKNRGGFLGYDPNDSNPGPSHRHGNNMCHAMPHPTGLPWNINEMSWGMSAPQPTLVEFTAQPEYQHKIKPSGVLHCKRKSAVEPHIPSKQLITDEKMAAHFDGLHISSEYGQNNRLGGGDESEDMELPCTSRGTRFRSAQRVVLCEEMRQLRSEPILPLSLLQRIEKPCMSLVLWKPPKRLDSPQIEDPNNNPRHADNNNCHGRTSLLVPDTNSMDMDM